MAGTPWWLRGPTGAQAFEAGARATQAATESRTAMALAPLRVQQAQNQVRMQGLDLANQYLQHDIDRQRLESEAQIIPLRKQLMELQLRDQQNSALLQTTFKEAESDLAQTLAEISSGNESTGWGSPIADKRLAALAQRYPAIVVSPQYKALVKRQEEVRAEMADTKLRLQLSEEATKRAIAAREISAQARIATQTWEDQPDEVIDGIKYAVQRNVTTGQVRRSRVGQPEGSITPSKRLQIKTLTDQIKTKDAAISVDLLSESAWRKDPKKNAARLEALEAKKTELQKLRDKLDAIIGPPEESPEVPTADEREQGLSSERFELLRVAPGSK